MKKIILLLALATLVFAGCTSNEKQAEATKKEPTTAKDADNTGRNEQDRSGGTLTSGDQSGTEADRDLTARIRKELVADDSLSVDAKNIKIITINGVVTLRGPVKSASEKSAIEAKAKQVAGVKNVDNQLEVEVSK
jgi:osmotically-inducible protein OsmY